eukprot:TRINITY_DN25641_c0_g1_i1.p1 TRINITY_DN25641_c0_g1~~TRINITY_DN25641_c0_g1_i1.p1  ORF type:complete len:240 (+),score=71.61 TRINITY_DN25641_c0_g1_i1:50-769(+)
MPEHYEDADDVLETLNMGGACATVRLLQMRGYGLQQVHDLVKRKCLSVANDASRGDTCEYYKLKHECILMAEPEWFCGMHYFKTLKPPPGYSHPACAEDALHHTLVFTNESMRCWMVVQCDPRIDIAVVDAARQAALALRDLLHHLEFPVADISFFVHAPVSSRVALPERHMRENIPLTPPLPLPQHLVPLITELTQSEFGQRVLRDIKKQKPGRVRLGCDPPPGSTVRDGRTVVLQRQ